MLPGGCALNTCRVLRWLTNDDDDVSPLEIEFFGSVGEDENRRALEDIVRKGGVNPRYLLSNLKKTY